MYSYKLTFIVGGAAASKDKCGKLTKHDLPTIENRC